MKKSKVLLLMLCTAALSMAAAFGTLAYLMDTEAVTNTFTVGQVQITLDEADVDDTDKDGNTTERDTANVYHLLPGQTYTKDPTIHVDAKSEDCYLFVKVENGIAAIETTDEEKSIAGQMKALNWVKVEGVDNLYVLAKGEGADKYAVSKGANVVVFDEFTIDGAKTVNVAEGETVPAGKFDIAAYKDAKIIVTAYAVQAAGFEDQTPKAIWDATFGAPAAG